MSNLNNWEKKMTIKRKKSTFKEYLKNITSWSPIVFYKNNGLISVYPQTNRVKGVKKFSNFSKDREEIFNINMNYNFKQNFFKNFNNLFKKIEIPATLEYMQNENSSYADLVCGVKNTYLSSNVTFGSENVLYSFSIKNNSINIFNSVSVRNYCNNIYFTAGITNSYNIFYSKYIDNSNNIWFCENLSGCKECIFCDNLSNQSFCIYNKKYSKDEYEEKKEKILKNKNEFIKNYKSLKQNGHITGSKNAEGGGIINSYNIKNGFFVNQIKNGKNLVMVGGKDLCEEMYDCFQCASKLENYNYGGVAAGWGDHLVCNYNVEGSYMYYNMLLEGCSYCIGCIGLKNKSFCILNKQYSKDERFQLADKIFEQMDKDGILGDFFPGSMNPFYFNDTAAYLIDDSFTKEEVEAEGYLWRDDEIKVDIPDGLETIFSSDLNKYQGFDSDGNRYINPDILKKIIIDGKGNYYRVIKMEYDFLVKHGLPLPEIHWLDRIKLGFKFK